ncbi:Teneurin-1 and related extracellular matrix proteins, contain EGF-like repeats [Plasmopara halstedii]|uniref:Teneurin-1 and related extracellular matrix proteins, contain EGF-like repeats n=1 Tax=Plasmopara halstedii TaxID=4781 RepID=A0A0P1AQQ5_PLAHL|nr:Teneurin-1 and related extracellular matrix proteins, contain EGF-like repeats [Plasmopara halstedii]CEG43460.1 Teneurin-1 and related extracellular matrix proteins, contain EGF-like repeats [Plasmopara halstedii]|eukprot:XP_024579829.1 Teneurin-1 and related extracellular matrix proteins, contain EGF-like repeats [Plasmopara halstedii]
MDMEPVRMIIRYDCKYRICPHDIPWVDFATGSDSIRSIAQECSNRGHCNRNNGKCECDAGFTGSACERLQLCRTNCNGHGKCLSMRAMAAMRNDYNLFHSTLYDTPWDADRIYGCVCDYGYTGVDCSLRQCPYGDDPITTGQVDEVQSLSCLCNGCTGTFTLSFRGETTRSLDGNIDTAATLKAALEDLKTIRSITVTLYGGTTLCDSDGVSAILTFTHEHGDVPALVIDSSLSGGIISLTVETDGTQAAYGPTPLLTVRGTKEWLECSGRGSCNTLIGLCACAADFGPSDGLGSTGNILDCGYYSGSGLTKCAGITGSMTRCYSHGRCMGAPLYQCLCDEGYGGYDCSRLQCPTGRAWVEEAATNNVAHTSIVPCSNAGLCSSSGTCKCLPGFEGSACNRMSCPSRNGAICSDRGTCRTLRELAALTPTTTYTTAGFIYGVNPNAVSTWDADMIQGCYCDKVPLDRGKNVRYEGYSCSKTPCPSGDDPWTINQVNEVQTVSCAADGGTFTLSFRGENTLPIAVSASPAIVKSALERLLTVTNVSITFATGSHACSSAGNDMKVTFYSPSGDLPLLSISAVDLTHSTTSVNTQIVQTTQGTKEDIICSNRGRCDEDTGTCLCSKYHTSSNALGDYGTLDDCGAVDVFMTHGEL